MAGAGCCPSATRERQAARSGRGAEAAERQIMLNSTLMIGMAAAVGLALVSASAQASWVNTTELNSLSANSLAQNGAGLQGIGPNGMGVQGTSLNGSAVPAFSI